MTSGFEQLWKYPWPTSPPYYVGSLGVRLAPLAISHGLMPERYEADGLGPATGVVCRLRTGRAVLLEEHDHAIAHLGAMGPAIHADAREVALIGPEPILAEVLRSFGLGAEDVTHAATGEAGHDAAIEVELFERWRDRRTKNQHGS